MGTTEVIAPSTSFTSATFLESAPNPTFAQIGMAGMIGMITAASNPTVEEPKVEEPKAEEPKAEEPKVEEPKVEEPKVEEPKVEEPAKENTTNEASVPLPETEGSGIFGFFRRFYNSLGGAVHR